MGKETKDLLKALLANTELIMKHLNIAPQPAKEVKKENKAPKALGAKKPVAKAVPVKKVKK